MNELQWYDATIDGALQGWSTINVTSGADGHPYAANWWPTAHVIGYEHGFINMASDITNVLGGKDAVVPLPDFKDAYQTQRVLQAAVESARNRCPIKMSQIK
jgi:predicted dehydrogenase